MSSKNKNLILVICLLSGVLVWILGCNAIPKALAPDPNRFPVKSWNITMDLAQREDFFTQLQHFADEHSLEFTTISYDSELETFLVEMDGDGFQITIEVVRSVPGEINIDFYIHYANNGEPISTSQETVDELFNDLKTFFGEIPNVTINEEN